MSALGLNLHKWQTEVLASCSTGANTACLAPNGSGKSSILLTSLILWFLSEFPKGRAVVISGSWAQLKSQLFDNLKRFSGNRLFAGWEFQEAAIKTPQRGWAQGFSVENPFNLEGQHEDLLRDSPVLVVVDEAKAISDLTFQAIDKFTPTFKIVVSSAGPASGRLYKIFTSESKHWFRRVVTYRDCPHLKETQRLADLELYGETSTFYRNRWLSEFASDAGESVISLDSLRACQANPPVHRSGIVTAGADFAAGGGDSCVLAIANGNRLEVVDSWKSSNPKNSAGRFIQWFRKLKLTGSQITGDSGGLGVGFLYDLQEAGYYIRGLNNGAPAKDSERYCNLAAELWDRFSTLVENKRVILPNNERLMAELSNRRREYDGKGRIRLESKEDMRARGAASPDHADAAILAMMAPGAWGSFTANLNPASAQHQAELYDQVLDLMVRTDQSRIASQIVQWGGEGGGATDFSRLW